jgi:hypothetical protein
MEAICSSETSVDTHRTTRRYIPEDGTLLNQRCENLKSYMVYANSNYFHQHNFCMDTSYIIYYRFRSFGHYNKYSDDGRKAETYSR